MESHHRFLSPSVVMRVVEYPPALKLLPPRSSILQQRAPPASLLPQHWRLRSASLLRSMLPCCQSRSRSNAVQSIPTLVDAETEWSLKILTKRLDCEYDPRLLLGCLYHGRLGMYTNHQPSSSHKGICNHECGLPWDVLTSRPVATLTISLTHLHHATLLLSHLLDH